MNDALRSGHDPRAETAGREWQLMVAAIYPSGGLGNASDSLDGTVSLGVVFEIDLDLVVLRGARAGRWHDAHALEITLGYQYLQDGGCEARIWMCYGRTTGHLTIADASEEIADRVSEHYPLPTHQCVRECRLGGLDVTAAEKER